MGMRTGVCVPVESVLSQHPQDLKKRKQRPAGCRCSRGERKPQEARSPRPRVTRRGCPPWPFHWPLPGVVPAGHFCLAPGLPTRRLPWEGRVWGCGPPARNQEHAAVQEALVKLFPDSSEAENPQASAFADCQGHRLPLARSPLSVALFWPSVAADAAGSPHPHAKGSSARPDPPPRVPSAPGRTERVGRPDTPQVLGSGSLSPGWHLRHSVDAPRWG